MMIKKDKLFDHLNILVAICCLFAIYFDYCGQLAYFSILKPLSTILIILIAFMAGNKRSTYFIFTLLALLFCLGGDIFLLNHDHFVLGLISFLVAHLLFTIAFIKIGGFKYYFTPLLALLAFGIAIYVFVYEGMGDLKIPVAVYILVITLMSWQGISLYLWQKKKVHLVIAVAVILFLISDAIIAVDKFKIPSVYWSPVNLAMYWTSIALLANSVRFVGRTQS